MSFYCIRLQAAKFQLILLLLGHSDSLSLVTGRCCVLTTHSKTPVMSKTTVSFDLLQTFQILTKLVLQTVRQNLRIFSILDILWSVQVVIGYLVLSRILHDGHQSLLLFVGKFTSTFVHVDIGFLQTDVGEASSDSFDGSHGVHDLCFSIDVGVHHTKDVLELAGYN